MLNAKLERHLEDLMHSYMRFLLIYIYIYIYVSGTSESTNEEDKVHTVHNSNGH